MPNDDVRRTLNRARNIPQRVRRALARGRFRYHALRTPPVTVEQNGDIGVHTLCGHRGVTEAIAALKSFYRFTQTKYPLIVHEDGSLTAGDVMLVREHFPRARIIPRKAADREVIAYLEANGLTRCAALRKSFTLALKFFDVPFYSAGSRVLYMDSDILFFRRPDALLDALTVADAEWRDRFTSDIATSYSWRIEQLEEIVRQPVHRQVNSGLLLLHRSNFDWRWAEDCLAMPPLSGSRHYLEQTLFAVDLSRRGGQSLPLEYDVCFRHTWRDHYDTWLAHANTGHEVVSQHYCGSARQRSHFYTHFVQHVAPRLRNDEVVGRDNHPQKNEPHTPAERSVSLR